MVGDALQKARQANGETRAQLGERLYMSPSMINEIEHHRKRVPKDRRVQICSELDCGEVYLEMAREATGGPMAPAYLDRVDNHRMVAILKFEEEAVEAIEQLHFNRKTFLETHCPEGLTPETREDVFQSLVELAEVATATFNTMIRVATSYGISLSEVWRRHEMDLVAKGYLSKEKTALMAAR